MKKVEIILRPEKLEDLKTVFNNMGIQGMTVTTILGCGNQKGMTQFYRGTVVNVNLIHKVKVETVVKDSIVEDLIKNVRSTLATGTIGDGKIFVYDVADAVRIRTGETGDAAL